MASGMSRRLIAFASLIAAVLGGCTSNQVVGRYKSAMCENQGSQPASCTKIIPTASAYAVSIKTPSASAAAGGTAFPERALAAYINVLANPKLSPTVKDLRTNLAAALGPASSSEVEDRTIFHRTIIVTVRKEGFNPADRLEATDVTIELGNARFDSWDTLATTYTTINAGTMQLTQARGFTESLSGGIPNGAVSASAGASQTNTRAENLAASIQAETLSATVEENGKRLVIYRQGGYGVDLTGNTIIKVDMAYSENPVSTYIFSVSKYVDAKGKWLPGQKITLQVTPVSIPTPATKISAMVSLKYTIRHVESGDDTYVEKEQKVLELTRVAVPQKVMLVSAREASPPGFALWEAGGPYDDFPVKVARPGRAPVGLCFDSYNEAADFLAYMKAGNAKHPSRIGDAQLGFVMPPNRGLEHLISSELGDLEVQPRCF